MIQRDAGGPRVLITVPPGGASGNPFIDLLTDAVGAAGARPVRFTWLRGICGRYDVVHFHWPEHLFIASSVRKRLPKIVVGIVFLLRLAISRVPVVLTQHNLATHESVPGYVRFFNSWVGRMVDLRVYLNESPENDMSRGLVILHPVYPRRGNEVLTQVVGPVISTFGSLRPYKGLEGLLEAFALAKATDCVPPESSLIIAGQPSSPDYATHISKLAEECPGVEFRPGYVDDADLEDLIEGSRAVILPYKSMYNSGAVILALGLGARVLIPSSPSTESLKREFPAAVSTYEGLPSSSDVAEVLAPRSEDSVDSSSFRRRRSLDAVGRLHADLYVGLTRLPRRWTRDRRRRVALDSVRRKQEFVSHSRLNASMNAIERHS
ncbi:GDP-mannose--glycolipid 4-beta-D-mannosyltransferase [Zhihengliuella alba]|uniref:GDP-mannose--glycolipid 4-beta-D-mannosyltransferase n=1 Tax=Zhihengliuella alba TaxID=547018 RepID=A0ABP7CYC9_9MICC